jgi:putative DNA primase/helicase
MAMTTELDTPVLVNSADVEAVPIRWLWPGRLPRGRLSLLAGMPGLGKSFATADFAARVSTGTPWPDGTACERGSVLFVAAEDDPADTVRPRLDAHNADTGRVHMLRGVHRLDRNGKPVEAAFMLDDLKPLERALDTLDDVRLVIVDPIGSYLCAKIDTHRDTEVRSVLARSVLRLFADDENAGRRLLVPGK